MRRVAMLALGMFIIAGSTSAGRRHWYTDKKWWIGEAVIVGSTMADANSTCRGIKRGGVEQNVLLGPSPHCGHIYAFEGGAAGYWTVFHILDWHWWDGDYADPKLGWRLFGY